MARAQQHDTRDAVRGGALGCTYSEETGQAPDMTRETPCGKWCWGVPTEMKPDRRLSQASTVNIHSLEAS